LYQVLLAFAGTIVKYAVVQLLLLLSLLLQV